MFYVSLKLFPNTTSAQQFYAIPHGFFLIGTPHLVFPILMLVTALDFLFVSIPKSIPTYFNFQIVQLFTLVIKLPRTNLAL